MRRCVIVLALLIGVGVCLVACGREEGGSPATADLSGDVSDAKPPPEFSGVLVSVNEQDRTFALEGRSEGESDDVTRWFRCVHERYSWPFILERWKDHPNVTVYYFEGEENADGPTPVASVYFGSEYDTGRHTWDESLDLSSASKDPA